MPRTTLDLDSAVLAELRQRAASEHKSMGQVASEVLARSLRSEGDEAPSPLRWTTHDLGEPLVDLDDKDAVQRALDGSR